jgi:hypothetical protein
VEGSNQGQGQGQPPAAADHVEMLTSYLDFRFHNEKAGCRGKEAAKNDQDNLEAALHLHRTLARLVEDYGAMLEKGGGGYAGGGEAGARACPDSGPSPSSTSAAGGWSRRGERQ